MTSTSERDARLRTTLMDSGEVRKDSGGEEMCAGLYVIIPEKHISLCEG